MIMSASSISSLLTIILDNLYVFKYSATNVQNQIKQNKITKIGDQQGKIKDFRGKYVVHIQIKNKETNKIKLNT